MHTIKLTECRTGIKFVKTPLAVEQNKYLRKILNVHIVFDSDAGQKNPSSNFKFKDCFLGATSIVKNSDNEKYMYWGYGITFDSAASSSFDNDVGRNVVIFDVDNSS